MRIRLYDVTRITRTGLVPHSAIDAEDGAITAVYDTLPAEEPGVRSVDAKGAYAAPGFIDIHLHGGGGVEFMDATPERIRAGCAAHARHGTTTLLPTTLAASPELTLRMIRAVRQAQAATTECTIAGVHLEGPFLSPAQSGAQSPDALSLPTSGLWDRLLDEWPGGVRIMGAAPELPGAMALGEALRARGVVASIAHSDADYETCRRALACGFTDITHIYSGCSMVHRKNGYRFGGVVEAGLLEEVRQLLSAGLPRNATAMQAIGYKEFAAALRGEEPLSDAVAAVKLRSRQYAKRQLTWLRRNPDIHWILWGEEPNFPQGLQNATEYLTALGLR